MTFELDPDLAKTLPPTVATILQEFIATLAATMRLESLVLFGSAAEGRLRPTSDPGLVEPRAAIAWALCCGGRSRGATGATDCRCHRSHPRQRGHARQSAGRPDADFGHDPFEYLRAFPLQHVQVVHINGGVWIELEGSRRLLDDHVHDVPDIVFNMLSWLAEHCPQPLTVILERDGEYPEFAALLRQLQRARSALKSGRAKRSQAAHELAAV